MPTGRPKLISGPIIRKVADCFFDGLTDDETALLCDVDVRTIRRARAAQFCPAIKKAETARLQQYIIKIRDGKQRDWVRIAWFLERRYPERFAKPEIQLSFQNNYSQHNLTLNITGQEAKEIEAIAEPVRQSVQNMFKNYKPGQIGNGNGNGNGNGAEQ